MFVVYNGGDWGRQDDRIIDTHKLSTAWTEGNGANFVPPRLDVDDEPEENRGTGSGVTWKCATDTNISNKKANCSSKWNGGTFESMITDQAQITSKLVGQWVEFDVTLDVNSFLDGDANNNFGWIIKKSDERNSGRIAFASNENADSTHRPQLVLKLAATG